MLCDEEDGSDSARRGGASIPNCLYHPTNDLLTQGSSILNFFRPILICIQDRYGYWRRDINLTLLILHLMYRCLLLGVCQVVADCYYVAFIFYVLNCVGPLPRSVWKSACYLMLSCQHHLLPSAKAISWLIKFKNSLFMV